MAKLLKFISLSGLVTLSLAVTACRGGHAKFSQDTVIGETYVHKYGLEVPSNYWSSAGEHGSVISTLGNGVVLTKNYSSGILDGETTFTYPHSSQIQKIEYYQNGNLLKETEFYFDGTPKIERNYQNPENGMTISSWYLTGIPKSIERYVNDQLQSAEYYSSVNHRDAIIENSQGIRFIRDDYGQLISSDKIEDGEIILRQTYYSNGSPKEIITYKNGKIDGTKRSYLPAGEPKTIEEWVNGQQEGLSVIYNHGEKFAEVPYSKGEKHGIEYRYRDGQIKFQEINWNCGQLHGPSVNYIGECAKTEWYYRGKSTTQADFEFMTNRSGAR